MPSLVDSDHPRFLRTHLLLQTMVILLVQNQEVPADSCAKHRRTMTMFLLRIIIILLVQNVVTSSGVRLSSLRLPHEMPKLQKPKSSAFPRQLGTQPVDLNHCFIVFVANRCEDRSSWPLSNERIFVGRMTSDRRLKRSREGSKCRVNMEHIRQSQGQIVALASR